MHLRRVFLRHVHQYQFGSLSRQASRIILGHVGPHHLLRLRRKCHSGRGHCTRSGRPHASVDSIRTLPRDLTHEIVFVLTDETRMRQFFQFWDMSAPPITFLFRCTRPDVSRFRDFCTFVKFELHVSSACDASCLPCKGSRAAVWNETDWPAVKINLCCVAQDVCCEVR